MSAPVLLALQATIATAAAPATDGFQFEPAWVVAGICLVVSTLAGTVAVLYRSNIVALRERILWLEDQLDKHDARDQRLIEQIGRVADVQDRSVSLFERGARR